MSVWRPPPVSRWAVEHATRLRLAGDWPGACAAASVAVHPNLTHPPGGFSPELEEDLRHLAPDLLRWFMPREPGSSMLRFHATYRLREYDRHRPLFATVISTGGVEQVLLALDDGTSQLDDRARDLPAGYWDTRCTADLRARYGGVTRTPFFDRAGGRLRPDQLGGPTPEGVAERALALHDAGHAADAWAVAGFDLRVLLFEPEWGPVRTNPAALAGDDIERVRRVEVDKALAGLRPIHATLAEPWEHPVRLEWAGRCLVVDWPTGARPRVRLVPMPPRRRRPAGRDQVERAEFGCLIAEIPRVWPERVRCPPELAGLLDGTLSRADLHPLVQAALFPDAAPLPPPLPEPPRDRVKVYCGNAAHEIVMRDGAIHVPHTPAEIARERVLATLGGRMRGCVAALEGWRDPTVRMPRQMRALRDSVLALVRRGDPGELIAALDRGLDPHLRDTLGATLLHLLPHFPGTDLVPRLLAAGLDPTIRDRFGRTPAERASEHGRPDVARALDAAAAPAG